VGERGFQVGVGVKVGVTVLVIVGHPVAVGGAWVRVGVGVSVRVGKVGWTGPFSLMGLPQWVKTMAQREISAKKA
jgi:hypothetical protein